MTDNVLAQLDSPDLRIRQNAKQQLRNVKSNLILQLVTMMQDASGYKSVVAAQLLLELGPNKCDEQVRSIITSTHPILADLAFESELRCADNNTLSYLIDCLPYTRPAIQLRILQYIAANANHKAVPSLIALLRFSESIAVQHATISTLAALQDARAKIFIQPFAKHDNAVLRKTAELALEQLENAHFFKEL